jgi:hypothetical protein
VLDRAELPPPAGPLSEELADELVAVAAWLEAHAAEVRLLHVEGELASPLPRLKRADAPVLGDVSSPGLDDLLDESLDATRGPIALAAAAAIGRIGEMAGAQPLRCAAC